MDDSTEQTTEVRERDAVTDRGDHVQRQTVATSGVASADNRVVMSRIVWYIAGFIIALLAIRILLLILGANRDSGFVDFIYALSGMFAAPFAGIFPAPTYGQFFFDTASVVAILVYALVAWGLVSCLRLIGLVAVRAFSRVVVLRKAAQLVLHKSAQVGRCALSLT